MQNGTAERGRVHLSECNHAPTVTSHKATDFFVIGQASEGIICYCLCLGKAFLNLLGDALDNCVMGTLSIYRRVVSPYRKITG